MTKVKNGVIQLPLSIEECQGLIGALVLDPRHVDDVACIISADDISRQDHRDMYRAILALHERGDAIDVITVMDEYQRTGEWTDSDTVASIIAMANALVSGQHATTYARIIARDSAIRRIIDAGSQIQLQALQGSASTAMEVIDAAESQLMAVPVQRSGNEARSVRDSAASYIDALSRRTSKGGLLGITTGISLLDEATDGLEPGLVIIAGRPSTGKTALATSIMHAAAQAGHAGVMLSMEMSEDQMWHRLQGCQGVPIDIAKHPQQQEHWELVDAGVKAIRELPMHIDISACHTVASARRSIRRMHRHHGISLAVIDYLQLMDPSSGRENDNRNEQLSAITRPLKVLAMELQIPILLLSQLNRDVDKRKGHRPMLSDLRESGSIEQDADIVLFTHSDWVYSNKAPADRSKIIVGKNRQGRAGIDINARFDRPCARFLDPDEMTLARWREHDGGSAIDGFENDVIEWGQG